MTLRPLLLAFLCLALGACPSRERIASLAPSLAGCPRWPTDAVLADVQAYVDCPLPDAVARLVRTDYTDDEIGLPDWNALRRYDGRVPLEAFAWQLDQFIAPGDRLAPWMDLDRANGSLRPDPLLAPDLVLALPHSMAFAAPAASQLQDPLDPARPFRPERQAELRRTVSAAHPVGALRVVLDPGHFGGGLARFESRELKGTDRSGNAFTIREGDLTLRTALELKRKLEDRGVRVFLTRDGPGAGHPFLLAFFRPSAERLMRHLAADAPYNAIESGLPPEDRQRLRTAVALHAVRKQFVFESLRYRMQRVAALEPDLLVAIHFNASSGPAGASHEQEILAMVKGNHEPHRLSHPYDRFRALRDAFEVDELNASAHLAALCLRGMTRTLGLPIVKVNHYPDHRPIVRADGTPSGVDAWNGVIFRYVDWPTVLTEGPHMDERDEIPRLDAAMRAPLHQPGTRTERYAEGLGQGILEWASQWLAQEHNDFGARL